jgi:hypothetical protein
MFSCSPAGDGGAGLAPERINYATPAAAALTAEDAASDLFEEGVSSACFDERTEAQRAGYRERQFQEMKAAQRRALPYRRRAAGSAAKRRRKRVRCRSSTASAAAPMDRHGRGP